jgi:peptide/nickel transport system substrate-binding protein
MRTRLIGLFAIAAVVAAACSSSGATPTAPDITKTDYKAEPVGNTGGKLVMGEWQEPVTAWTGIYDNSATDFEAFGISLWQLWSATSDYKWYGQLATNIPTVSNGGVVMKSEGMDVTINLREGAKWSDGQPLNCDDLAYMVTWMMDAGQIGSIQGHVGWEFVTGVDGGTGSKCVAHFSKIYEGYLTLWAPLLPAHYLKTASVADANTKLYAADSLSTGVYSGPYMPTEWAAGAQINYLPNPQFWSTIKKTTAPFDSVTFKYYSDATAMIAGYKNGEVDVAMNLNHNDLGALGGIDAAEVDAIDGTTYEQHSWNYASLKTKFGADGAKALMTALHYAYNKNEIIARITNNTVSATCNFNSPLVWWYKQLECPAFDVAKANQILDDAGFTKGADGMRSAPNGTKVELLGCTSAARPYRIDTLTLLSTQLANIGVKLEVKGVPSTPDLFGGWSEQGSNVPCNTTHGNFDVAEFAWVTGIDPVAGIYPLYNSKYDPSQGDHSGINYIRVNIPSLDTALDTMYNTVDLTVIKNGMWTVQDIYVKPDNAFPEIPLYNWKTVILKSPKMHNVVNNATSATNTWNIEDWWRAK